MLQEMVMKVRLGKLTRFCILAAVSVVCLDKVSLCNTQFKTRYSVSLRFRFDSFPQSSVPIILVLTISKIPFIGF